jgi:tetratricopeptide (TPR) repeat protein
MNKRTVSLAAVSLSAMLLLTACDSAEERAQGHYESAVSLLEAGDVDRAIIELRNVFQLNGLHLEARKLYAATMLERGNLRDALGSYTLVSEQDPNDLESRIAIARLAAETGSWDAFELNTARAIDLAPENPEVRLLQQLLAYRQAVIAEDSPLRSQAAAEVAALRDELPGDLLISRVLIEDHIFNQRFSSALEELDAALETHPASREFLQMRLALLAQLGEDAEVERQLTEMIAADPSDSESKQALIRWHLARGNPDRAEEILRADAYGEAATTEARVAYIAFVRQIRGEEAALEEVTALLEQGQDTEILRSLRAGLDFDAGRRAEAIAELEDILATAEPGETARQVKISLARMMALNGDQVASRQHVEEILSEDPTNVEALKMRAGTLIDQDRPDDAILDLRTALDQSPRDAQVMTLMAGAYLRSGNRELAREMLSLATEASNNAPEESLRYARLLIEDGNLDVAEPILINALRLSPNNVPILLELGRVYLGQQDWARLEQVEGTLRRLATEETSTAADSLRVARLQAQDRSDEAITVLESILRQQGTNAGAELEIVRTHLRDGDVAAAEVFVDGMLEEKPGDELLRFLKASILEVSDRVAEAEEVYRAMLSDNPQNETVWRSLYILQSREGRLDDARATLESGLESLPGAPNLQWALAGEYEREGDIDGAIRIYEALYQQNSDSIIVANNLASLISTYRTDQESLDRAWRIARRLRGAERPEFQDTYGWIALRLGEVEEAIAHLEPAAAALQGDPLVQYHLGMAYARTDRRDDAIRQLRRAIELAGPADTRPQFEEARQELARLEALPETEPAE